jgi:hypothetical protein
MFIIGPASRDHTRRATAIGGAMLAAVVVLAIAASGALAGSRSVDGKVVDQVVTDGSCTAILCTRGVYSGTIRGTVEFAITSLTPTDLPNVQGFVGHSTIHTANGDLRCADSGSFNADPQSSGEGVHLCVVTGGTGRYAGATGYLQERLHFVASEGNGIYTGEVSR